MQNKREKIPGHKSRWYRLELTFPQLLNPFEDLHALHEIILPHPPSLLIECLLPLYILSLRHVEIRVDDIVSVAGKGFAELSRELIMIDTLAKGGGNLRREVTVHQEVGKDHFTTFITNCPDEFGGVVPDTFANTVHIITL